MTIKILQGNCINKLKTIADKTFHTCVTSPPYWGLRDYGTAQWQGGDPNCDHIEPSGSIKFLGRDTQAHDKRQYKNICKKCDDKRIDAQLGLEETPQEYVANLVDVFREVKRVLRDDGTVWLNLGDSYFGSSGQGGKTNKQTTNKGSYHNHKRRSYFSTYPPDLIEPCILAGCPEGGYVLDIFGGSGTTALVAERLGRNATLIELNKSYVDIINNRLKADNSLFMEIVNDN